MMPNRTIEEAIAKAPLEPMSEDYEIQPLGSPASKRAQLHAQLRLAVAAGLKVTIRASGTTLESAEMLGLSEFAGAPIERNDSRDQFGYFYLMVSRRMHPQTP
jgi:hypothetical protein